MRIRTVTANMYVGNKTPGLGVERLIKTIRPWRKPDSLGLQEVGAHMGNLNGVKGYRAFWKAGESRFTRSNAILVRDKYEILGTKFYPAAAGAGTVLTPPRNILVVKYRKGKHKIAHVNTHFHVVPEETLARQSESEYGRAGRQYRDHAKLLNEIVKKYEDAGYIVIVTGDINARKKHGQPEWKYSVYNYIKKVRMRTLLHSVDMIAYPRSLKLTAHRTVSRTVTGSDAHDAIVAVFRLDKRSKRD